MDWVFDNLSVIILVVGVIAYIIAFIVKLVTKGKKGDILQSIANVIVKLPEIIVTAEKVGTTGEERKLYAMTQAELIAKALGITLTDQQKTEISNIIDGLVALSKTINLTSGTNNTITPLLKKIGE